MVLACTTGNCFLPSANLHGAICENFLHLKKRDKKMDLYLKGVGETPSEVELWYHETLNEPDQAGGGQAGPGTYIIISYHRSVQPQRREG
jgi:hypothetical protein